MANGGRFAKLGPTFLANQYVWLENGPNLKMQSPIEDGHEARRYIPRFESLMGSHISQHDRSDFQKYFRFQPPKIDQNRAVIQYETFPNEYSKQKGSFLSLIMQFSKSNLHIGNSHSVNTSFPLFSNGKKLPKIEAQIQAVQAHEALFLHVVPAVVKLR